MEPIIKVEHLRKVFQTTAGEVAAADDISFSIEKGDIYGIIGLSGARSEEHTSELKSPLVI